MSASQLLPLLAIVFAAPQFLPQISKLRRTGDSSGLSLESSALTCVNNAAWIVYFVDARYWTAIVPIGSVVIMTAYLSTQLLGRASLARSSVAIAGFWCASLMLARVLGGPIALRSLLTVAFIVQVTPSLWKAFKVEQPTGLSLGTWRLVFAEMACWLIFGFSIGDHALFILGLTGVAASTAMMWRAHGVARRPFPPTSSVPAAEGGHPIEVLLTAKTSTL